MGWLEGLLSGYADQMGDIRRQNAAEAERSATREGDIYKNLLNSEDPEIRGMAATGLLANSQPKKLKSGFGGWMGEMQANPMYPQLMKYITTPKQLGEDVSTTVTTPEKAGYMPTLPDTSQPAAQSTNKTTTPGAPGPQPTQATPAAGPPPPPSSIGVAGMASAAGEPPPTVPPEMLASLAGPTSAVPGGGIAEAPPPPPPSIAQVGPDQLRSQLGPETKPAPLTQTTRTPIMGLPHVFPTHAESIATDEQAKMRAEISTMQEAYRGQGDPEWQRKGFDAYLAQHARGVPGVMEGDSQQVSGPLAHQLGVPDGTWMQPLYDKTTGNIIHWIPGGAKMAGVQKLSPEDEAAKNIGYPSSRDVPPAELPRYRAELNKLTSAASSARSAGTSAGKYGEEKSRILPANVENAANAIRADAAMTSVFLNGRSQAFKDAVSDAITRKGGDINKLSEATRSMAEMAKDVLPSMDVIAGDAKTLNDKGLMGVIASRWNDFLAGTIGAADLGTKTPADAQLVAKFRSEASLLQQAVAKAHAGARGAGSPYMLEHMDQLLSTKKMDYDTFIGSMSGFKLWMNQYAQHLPEWGTPGVEPEQAPAPGAPPAPPAAAAAGPAPTAAAGPVADPAEAALAAGKRLYTAPSGNVYVNGRLATKPQ